MLTVLSLTLTLVLFFGQNVSSYTLCGYLCPTCPSAPDPTSLIQNINKYYGTVVIAFIGWDSNGNILNQFDDPSKGFTLTPQMVQNLQSQGRKVFISLGGGAGNILTCSDNSNSNFINTFTNGILNYTNYYGFDGVDFDIEHRSGDYVQCAYLINTVMTTLSSKSLSISMAPQMTNLYPEYNQVSAGFNELAPLVSITPANILDPIMPQMYNTWSSVETTAYAEQYVAELNSGYNVTADGINFYVQVPPNRILLGYPASRSGASGGYIDPSQLKTMYYDLQNQNLQIAGFMTWSIGWDQLNNWDFANTLGDL